MSDLEDKELRPVWHDSDDEDVVVRDEPEWLRKRRQVVEEESVTLGGKLTRLKPSKAKSGTRFKVLKQKGHKEPIDLGAGIKSLAFDGDGRHLAVIASGVKLYTIDESKSDSKFVLKNDVVDIKFEDYKIASLAFNESDKGILMIDRGKKLLNYDIHRRTAQSIASIVVPRTETVFSGIYTPKTGASRYYAISCADNGTILLCDSRTHTVTQQFKMNADCAGIGFHSNSLISCDTDANVYEWDIVGGRCRFKFKDDHSVHISSFALSCPFGDNARNAFLANGSTSGFLNLYPLFSPRDDQSHILQNELVKSFGNLSTEVTDIATDSGGNFIAYSSVHKRNALRIIYTPSFKVIANWPMDKINLGRVTSLSFCSQQNTLAVGNRRGKVQFFKLV